ncbi:MAG TPA: hypothetical protein VFO38_06175 [Candidatus Saccharimonadales bacterium]|nr:hypothetical protein [Candidatus Saccharimonadales bacterium]
MSHLLDEPVDIGHLFVPHLAQAAEGGFDTIEAVKRDAFSAAVHHAVDLGDDHLRSFRENLIIIE